MRRRERGVEEEEDVADEGQIGASLPLHAMLVI
jgi:hypothetical protein